MKNENQTKQSSGLPSRSMNCSADGHDKDAERKPPNYRHIKSCANCAHRRSYCSFDDDIYCKVYEYHTSSEMICDSYY